MIDVAKRSLGSLEDDVLPVTDGLPDQRRCIGDVLLDPVGVQQLPVIDLVDVEGQLVVHLLQLPVLVLEVDLELLPEDLWVE